MPTKRRSKKKSEDASRSSIGCQQMSEPCVQVGELVEEEKESLKTEGRNIGVDSSVVRPEPIIAGVAAGPEEKKKRRKKRKKEKDCAVQNHLILENSATNYVSTDEPKSSLEQELEWCISMLELGMMKSSATRTLKEQNQKSIHILRSSKTLLPKKRQVMRVLFGDYRSKMKQQPIAALLQERSKVISKETKVKSVKQEVLESTGTFFKKKTSDIMSNGSDISTENSFMFNFTIPMATST